MKQFTLEIDRGENVFINQRLIEAELQVHWDRARGDIFLNIRTEDA